MSLISCLLPTQEARQQSRLGRTPLVATPNLKVNFSKQKHTPIAHQHACFDFTLMREIPYMSSRHVRCELPLARLTTTGLKGGV
jgi:hypothetical protein